jgi:hypothetical protein
MRFDRLESKDFSAHDEQTAGKSFLPRGITLDELISTGSRVVTAVDLWALSLLTHRLLRKLALVDPQRYPGFDQTMHSAVMVLKSPQAQSATDPLPHHLAEVAFAVHYFLKESDLIPDETPEIGLADDFAIVNRVFSRNRHEIENVIHGSCVAI